MRVVEVECFLGYLPKADYFQLLLHWTSLRTCCSNAMSSLRTKITFLKSRFFLAHLYTLDFLM